MVFAAMSAVAADELTPTYEWHLPPGFPHPAVPADNPMSVQKVSLGRRLFFESRLSATGQSPCPACHRPELAYPDGKAHGVGATGDPLRRPAMSLGKAA